MDTNESTIQGLRNELSRVEEKIDHCFSNGCSPAQIFTVTRQLSEYQMKLEDSAKEYVRKRISSFPR